MVELSEVSRILGCNSHYEVLHLVGTGECPVFIDALKVRKRYKELAILVHPDKNPAFGAESAFKRLSEAYQCLVDKASQCIYLHQLLGQQSKHTRQKFKQKKKPFFKPKSATEPRLPKHARTPEEIWQIFQREEEEAARQDFNKKGFDRMYEETFPETKQNAKDASLRTEKQQQILDSCLDIKSKKWVAWTQPNCKRKRTETLIPEPAPATKDVAPSSIDCLLCRRTFSSLEILRKHEQFSKLHIANLSNKL